MTDNFVWGPWAGMGRRPTPINIRRQRSYARCKWWALVLAAAMALYYWMPK